jgi:ribosomal protein L40E
MNFFDKIGNKISTTGKAASAKAKEFAEVSKLNSAVNAENAKINTIFSDLGKKYYELKADAPDAEFAEYVNAINTAKDEIVRLTAQIEEIKALNAPRTCPNCGAQVADDAMFCNKCGTQVPPKQTPAEDAPVADAAPAATCPNCGAQVAADATFCTGCGTKLN